MTYAGVVTAYVLSQSGTVELEIRVTGPPAATTTLISINTATTTGTDDGANYREYGVRGARVHGGLAGGGPGGVVTDGQRRAPGDIAE